MKCSCGSLFTWFFAAGLVAFSLTQSSQAVEVQITIKSLAASESVAISPVSLGFHDGTYDSFDSGSSANMATELVAELGDGGDFLGDLTTMQASAVTEVAKGSFGPGIFLPGDETTFVVSLDPTNNRYLSYGAMVVPSNDAFIGNDNPTAVELFDAGGNFVGQDFTLTGANIWDAGTEVNGLTGAAYVVGQTGSDSPVEGGVVQLVTDLSAEFGIYSGENVPSGGMFNTLPNGDLVSFSFAVVPEPASLLLLGLGSITLLTARRVR